MIQFYMDGWKHMEKKYGGSFILPLICTWLFILVFIISFIEWTFSLERARIALAMFVISIIPQVIYYARLKRRSRDE